MELYCLLPDSLCSLDLIFYIIPATHFQEASGEGARDTRMSLSRSEVPTRGDVLARAAVVLLGCLDSVAFSLIHPGYLLIHSFLNISIPYAHFRASLSLPVSLDFPFIVSTCSLLTCYY